MQLSKKKELAARVLKVGKKRILFSKESLSEIKEAITRMDILDLHKAGAIKIKEISGRKKIVKRKHRRRTGKIKQKVNNRKTEYVILTRKLRNFAKHLLKRNEIDKEKHGDVRRKIRARKFRSKRHLKDILEAEKKWKG